jgi:exoribonuclease R
VPIPGQNNFFDDQLKINILIAEKDALDIEEYENQYMFDEDGNMTGLSLKAKTEATGMIENFMILANTIVAKFLVDNSTSGAMLRRQIATAPKKDVLVDYKYGK